MPKNLGKQIFTHGSFPKVGQKQKTEKKKERAKVGNNNGQLCIAPPPCVVHAKPPGPKPRQYLNKHDCARTDRLTYHQSGTESLKIEDKRNLWDNLILFLAFHKKGKIACKKLSRNRAI